MFATVFSAILFATFHMCSATGHTTETCVYEPYGDIPDVVPDPIGPDTYSIKFDTNVRLSDGSAAEPIIINVNRSWAPIGSDHLFAVMSDKFYQCGGFFRVVPDFVVQFGIAASPEETKKWDNPILDDPVLQSNLPWTVTYATAGPNTRTTQLFINTVDNSRLDADGFSPFGYVKSGFDTVLAIVNPTPDSSDGVNQIAYTKKGNDWLLEKYPNISLITGGELLLQ